MNLPPSGDTIVAICTPPGFGGIGVVRISGPAAFAVAGSLVRENMDFKSLLPNTVHYAHVIGRQPAELIDEVLVSVFRGPRSYTGEDVIEISAHGNPLLLGQIVSLAIAAGARQAVAGEFTLRAFESGRIDLVQAEAVADLVAAAGELSRKSALYQLSGKLSSFIADLRRDLLQITSLLEAYTDFPEEELPPAEKQQLLDNLDAAWEKLTRLADSYDRGRVIKSGIQIPIAGPTNAGKSSLFNAILAEERAIVTEVPGTTRDTVAESIQLAGLPVRLIDTAGLRQATTLIESEGVRRSRREIAAASMLLLVYDITLLAGPEADAATGELQRLLEAHAHKQTLLVINKIDLADQKLLDRVGTCFGSWRPSLVSAKRLTGVSELVAEIEGRISDAWLESGDENVLTNERHQRAVVLAASKVAQVRAKLAADVSFEFLAFDLRQAVEGLEEILGKITSEEKLAEIFSRFCIGK